MQNLSLLQFLKLLSAAAPFAPSEESPASAAPSEPTMPENTVKNESGNQAPQKSAPPTSSVRAYEIFSSRHEQAVRRAQKREE